MPLLHCVLLVEDDPITNFINSRIIKTLNISTNISIQKSVDDAIAFLKARVSQGENYPELIFLDINLPNKDGYDFMKDYREIVFPGKPPVVVVLTTSTHPNDSFRFSTLHARAYISKPLTKDKVLALMQDLFKV